MNRVFLFRRVIVPAILTVAILGTGAAIAFSDRAPTRGPVPPSAYDEHGNLDLTAVPDYILAYGRDGEVAGFVPREYLIPKDGSEPLEGVMPVLDENLEMIVGHMYPGKGFVPLGMEPNDVPDFEGGPIYGGAPPSE